MSTIVLNTMNGAVTEYDWTFQSLTATHAADESGLYTLGGDTDDGADIEARFLSGKPGGQQVQAVSTVFVAREGAGDGRLIVQGLNDSWEYPVIARPSGVAAVRTGRGIRESYLGFGYRNVDGAAFSIDRIDADVKASPNRRK